MMRTHALAPVLLGLSLLILGAGMLHAAPSETQWRALNEAVIEQHIMPRYQKLATQSQAMSQALDQLCAAPNTTRLIAAQTQFNATLQAWQGIQHVQFGPVTLLMRNHGLQYWPDKKNIGAKQLSQALAQKEAVFDEEYFRSASISIKGFPALERLLFSKKQEVLQNTTECRLAAAIAQHISLNTAAIALEWKDEAQQMLNPSEDGTYESDSAATTELMKSLVEPVDVIRDTKLLSPMGNSLQDSNWKRSESWRSQQSIENIRTNVAALHELYSKTTPVSVKQLLAESGDSAQAEQIEASFIKVEQTLAVTAEVQGSKLDANAYAQLTQLTKDLKPLLDQLEESMEPLGIHLGFNSRDGD